MQIAKRFSIAAWAEEENAKGHFCACGCGGRVQVLPMHRKHGIPMYVPEHRPTQFGAEIRALHYQGLMTAQDVARELRLQRKSVLPLADEALRSAPQFGIHCSQQIRVFTPKEVAKLRAALAKRADPRHDLTDAQWEKVAPIVSSSRGRARNTDERGLVNAILWVQRTGMRWDAIPSRYPHRKTSQVRLCKWRLDGTWARVCRALA